MGKEIMSMEGKSISQLISMELESQSTPPCQKQIEIGKEINQPINWYGTEKSISY